MNNELNSLYLLRYKFCTNFFSLQIRKLMFKLNRINILVMMLIFISPVCLIAQYQASPANWMYPNGNAAGTRHIATKSGAQKLDSILVKWSTPLISGDIQPLIGNIINNSPIISGFRAPNEIAAFMGDDLLIIDGTGKLISKDSFSGFKDIKGISSLIDTSAALPGQTTANTVVMGLETIEYKKTDDSLAYAYIAGYQNNPGKSKILSRLSIDLRPYSPNIFASIKPVFGKLYNSNYYIYATVNMTQPYADADIAGEVQYFRGFTTFNTGNILTEFPLPDIGDDKDSRVTVGPEVYYEQPSFMQLSVGSSVLLSTYPSASLEDVTIPNSVSATSTYADRPYLIGLDITEDITFEQFAFGGFDDFYVEGSRPDIRTYYVDIQDGNPANEDRNFILIAEGYRGIEGSNGLARLHLYDTDGIPLTDPFDVIAPPYSGSNNHLWSVAVGDVDGAGNNNWMPYYPNNPGKEIIVTQSSRDFAVPKSRLSILRYDSREDQTRKPVVPESYLRYFDTLATYQINGWVAAVNDLDAGSDQKEEIILVDGSILRILRLRDYRSIEFRSGQPFDTVFTHVFPNQTISSVAVSDLEGDGLNDLLVTTYDSTYVIGSLIKDLIDIFEPGIDSNPPVEYCAGDTIDIQWENKLAGVDYVNIRFQPYLNGMPLSGEDFFIAEGYPNSGDTASYTYVVDTLVLGGNGQFIVESSLRPSQIFDATPVLSFDLPVINLDNLTQSRWTVGDIFSISGNATCVDSVNLEFTTDNESWQILETSMVNANGDFNLAGELPCVEIFNCSGSDDLEYAALRVVSFKSTYTDSSAIMPIELLPYPFPVNYDEQESVDPAIHFYWSTNEINYPCDSVTVSISSDLGRSFKYVGTVPAAEGNYFWTVPLNLPDSVIVRFCCENSCVRSDEYLDSYKPSYIGVVAPNPFRPPLEQLEMVYRVPEPTNVTIRVYDQSNKLVAEILNGQPRQPDFAYTDTWDGRILNGSLAANGMYYISLELSNGAREIYPVFVRK